MQRRGNIFFTIVLSIVGGVLRAQEMPPRELCSPDQQYCVTVLDTALPGADPQDEFFTIAVKHGDRFLSKHGTMGYLLSAFWSPDGKYVAVNNRRANSGDYLWVFRLRDGQPLKVPADAGPKRLASYYAKQQDEALQHICRDYHDLTPNDLNKMFLEASAWTLAGELKVETDYSFWKKGHVIVSHKFKVSGDKLIVTYEQIERPNQAMQRTAGRPYAHFESVRASFLIRAVADLESR